VDGGSKSRFMRVRALSPEVGGEGGDNSMFISKPNCWIPVGLGERGDLVGTGGGDSRIVIPNPVGYPRPTGSPDDGGNMRGGDGGGTGMRMVNAEFDPRPVVSSDGWAKVREGCPPGGVWENWLPDAGGALGGSEGRGSCIVIPQTAGDPRPTATPDGGGDMGECEGGGNGIRILSPSGAPRPAESPDGRESVPNPDVCASSGDTRTTLSPVIESEGEGNGIVIRKPDGCVRSGSTLVGGDGGDNCIRMAKPGSCLSRD
jgi:hypothetical protein